MRRGAHQLWVAPSWQKQDEYLPCSACPGRRGYTRKGVVGQKVSYEE